MRNVLIHLQSLHPHHAMRHSALYCPLYRPLSPRLAFPSVAHNPHIPIILARALLPRTNDTLVHPPIRHLAALLPLPHHRPSPCRDPGRATNILHLAQKILRLHLARQNRQRPPSFPARTRIHVDSVRICGVDDVALPCLVLV